MNKFTRQILRNGLVAFLFALLALPAAAQRGSDPSIWNESMERFAREDRTYPPAMGAVLLTGSSSIARWNDQAAKALAPLTVISRGFGGSVMNDVLHHLDTVALKYKPRAILIYEGDNDTAYGIAEEEILGALKKIVDKVHKELPETRIYVMAVKPSTLRVDVWDNAQRVNAGYKEIAKHNPQVYYVDSATPFLKADGSVMTDIFVEDGLHLNPMGNLIWGSVIRAALMPQEARYE
ncbi:MAG: GDSL-type esterase/lipase family protein [Gammaproteobacteria bacterium]|nr:GDSL-type esterase/lipase family protein [Gammaproteobacteria bacterium]